MPKPSAPGPTLCPDCFLFQGIDTPIISRAGATLRCSAGHTWPGNDVVSDMEIFQQRQDLARKKRAAVEAQSNPNAVQEPVETTKIGVAPGLGRQIAINEEDHDRIAKLIGEFGDGATLYGTIMSLTMDLKGVQDELNKARKAAAPGAAAALNPKLELLATGDLPVTIIVPERYVQPLKDIAEANSCEVPDYMNSVIANGFDGGWFF